MSKINPDNLKTNAAGEFLYWSYFHLNKHTLKYYCGVTVNPGNRKSIWTNLKYKYAGEKVFQARIQYHDWANDWDYQEQVYSAPTLEELLEAMHETEIALIAQHDSFRNGYNSNPGGQGRYSRFQVVVTEPTGITRTFQTNKDAADFYGISSKAVHYYVYTSKTHMRKEDNLVFAAATTTYSAGLTTFITSISI